MLSSLVAASVDPQVPTAYPRVISACSLEGIQEEVPEHQLRCIVQVISECSLEGLQKKVPEHQLRYIVRLISECSLEGIQKKVPGK